VKWKYGSFIHRLNWLMTEFFPTEVQPMDPRNVISTSGGYIDSYKSSELQVWCFMRQWDDAIANRTWFGTLPEDCFPSPLVRRNGPPSADQGLSTQRKPYYLSSTGRAPKSQELAGSDIISWKLYQVCIAHNMHVVGWNTFCLVYSTVV